MKQKLKTRPIFDFSFILTIVHYMGAGATLNHIDIVNLDTNHSRIFEWMCKYLKIPKNKLAYEMEIKDTVNVPNFKIKFDGYNQKNALFAIGFQFKPLYVTMIVLKNSQFEYRFEFRNSKNSRPDTYDLVSSRHTNKQKICIDKENALLSNFGMYFSKFLMGDLTKGRVATMMRKSLENSLSDDFLHGYYIDNINTFTKPTTVRVFAYFVQKRPVPKFGRLQFKFIVHHTKTFDFTIELDDQLDFTSIDFKQFQQTCFKYYSKIFHKKFKQAVVDELKMHSQNVAKLLPKLFLL